MTNQLHIIKNADFKYIALYELIDMYEKFLDTNNANVHIEGSEYRPSEVLRLTDHELYHRRYHQWFEMSKSFLDEIEERRWKDAEKWENSRDMDTVRYFRNMKREPDDDDNIR